MPAGPAAAFGALISAAARDATAARGLALAYAALAEEQRHELVDAIVSDAKIEQVCPSLVLASLLSVEENAVVAKHIADELKSLDSAELRSNARTRALVAGDDRLGGLAVVRPLHGTFVEVLLLAWDAESGITHAHFEPLIHDGVARQELARLPDSLLFEEMPLSYAIDFVTSPLWNHRQLHGTLPVQIERFADLFSIESPQATD